MTTAEALALVLDMAKLVEDRTPDEQTALALLEEQIVMSETPPTSKRALLDTLRENAALLAEAATIRGDLYENRDMLVRLGLDMTPPVTQRELAEAAGVSETVIVKIERRSKP